MAGFTLRANRLSLGAIKWIVQLKIELFVEIMVTIQHGQRGEQMPRTELFSLR